MHEKERRLCFSEAMGEKLILWHGHAKETKGDARLSSCYCYYKILDRLIVAVNDFEDARVMDGMLTFAILFRALHHPSVDKLTLILPATAEPGTITKLQRRLACLNFETELHQLDYYLTSKYNLSIPSIADLTKIPSPDITYRVDKPYFNQALGPKGAGLALDIINELKRMSPLVDVYYLKGTVSFRINGLEFARLTTPNDITKWRLHIGVGKKTPMPVGTPLPEDTNSTVRELVHLLAHQRTATGNKKAKFYRLQSEHWLESLVLKKPELIDSQLKEVYTQVATECIPSGSGDVRRYIDALGLLSDGTLAVIELKAKIDVHAVLQAVDYWLWAEQNKAELQAYNYFPGKYINTHKQPQLYLAVPQGQLHQLCSHVISALQVPVTVVTLPKHWR